MSLGYLEALSHIACREEGFHGIPVGTILPLTVTKEEYTHTTTRTDSCGRIRRVSTRYREMIIKLTAPDGTRHHFHTDSDSIPIATQRDYQPPPSRFYTPPPPTLHHSIAEFVRHFHVPAPAGLEHPIPADHALLDLLEAIITAATQNQPHPAKIRPTGKI